ncbi:MAG: hypothetical protein MRJ65_11990, partial [Candidatus Brocadiaceae bacterium]|nr:hypothetical protein [Candidatus Brocadiaceae bacterium]
MRDEFPTKIKELLAKRVGFRCSNPECQKPTIGPSKNPRESINIGVASHITAASPGGPRYDPNLSPSERKSPENGIWLCQNCAKLVDSDPKKYLLETLTRWKLNSESLASKFIQEAFLPPKQTILQMSSVFLANKLDQIGTFLLNDIEQQLDQTQIAWREGRAIEAREWLRKAKGNNIIWETIPFQVKAKILSFELIFTLEVTGDINHAKQLADEIQTLAPSDNQTKLRALIAYKEKGPEEAIQLLGEQKDIDILNLKASLLLEMGEVNKCRKELSEIENAGIKPNAETYRIRALLFRVKKDMGKARLEIQKAIELEPKWKSIRFTAAVIDYFSALSPIAIPDSLVSWPVPVEWSAVKCDDTNQKRLEKASEIFLELAEKCSSGSEEQQMYKVWRLACLANDPGRQDEATEYCKTILRTENTNFCVISWVIARDFDVDLKPSEKALYSLIGKETVTPYQILSLVNCYLKSRRIKKAINLLDKKRYIFQKNDAEALWLNWQTQLLIKNKLPERALELIDNSEYANSLRITKTLVLQAIARKTDDWKPVIGHLENSFEETKNSEFLFECCKIKAQLNDWTYVADRAKQLVKEIGTPEVLRLAAIAAYNANRWDLCLQLLNDHCEFFKQKILPGQLRRIKALCMQNLGYLPQAIIEAKKLVDEDPNTENILSLMDIYYS